MSPTVRRALAVPVVTITCALALGACNGDSDSATGSGGSSSTPSSTSSSAPSSTSSSATSTPSSTTTTSASPTSTGNQALSTACITTTGKVAAATVRWNAALLTKKSSIIGPAAANFRTTAKSIRTTTKSAADKNYTAKVGAVAKDMETMASQNEQGDRNVSGARLTRDSRALASYCQGKVLS